MAKSEIRDENRNRLARFKEAGRNYDLRKRGISIVILYNAIILGVLAAFYPLIPTLLNYPPNSEEVSKALGTSNLLQYVIMAVYSCTVGTIFLLTSLKKFKNWENLDKNKEEDREILRRIRKKSMNLPVGIFLLQIVALNVPLIFMGLLVTSLNNSSKLVVVKVLLMTISLFSLAGVSMYIFSRRILKEILLQTDLGEKPEGKRLGLRKNIFIQLAPMFVVAILFTTLLGYSRIMTEKGDLIYTIYKNLLAEKVEKVHSIDNAEDALRLLGDIRFGESKTRFFVKAPDGTFTTSDHSVLGGYFLYYIEKPYEGDRIYDLNAEQQGIVMTVKGEQGEWKLGLTFQVASNRTLEFFVIGFLALLLLGIAALYYFVSSLSDEISHVANSLLNIAHGENIDQYKQLPVTSNDEIGDLVIAFNKIMERQLEYAQLKTEFVANISHELRTPINLVFASVKLLEENIEEDFNDTVGQSSRNIRIAKRNCLRLIRLINNLISSTTIDAGHLTLHIEPVDIIHLAKELTISATEYAGTKDIALAFESEIQEKTVYCDVDKMETVILNLLSNAIKFTRQKGSITVKVYEKGDQCIISVKDTGIGIPKSKQNLIFERFRQIDQSFVRSYEGSGIGLSLVKSLVELHKGRVYVESEEGVGSEFFIEVPIGTEKPGLQDQKGSISNIGGAGNQHKVTVELSDIYLTK